MAAVVLTGHGGPETLHYRTDVPVPRPAPGEVLVKVAAAGINNTDINTRLGWYAKSVTGGTTETLGAAATDASADGGWAGAIAFPRIQGADAVGRIVVVGQGVAAERLGQRVLIEPCFRHQCADGSVSADYLGSEWDGAFAQFVAVPASHAHAISESMSDRALAAVPCAGSTALNLLTRTRVGAGERVLVTGASGGVGSFAVQLAKARGAHVIAVAGYDKAAAVKALGAAQVVAREQPVGDMLGHDSVDVVIDVVGGTQWPALLDVLRPGGRYGVSGAIAGPLVELDLRTLYLKDLTLYGCTVLGEEVFAELVRVVETEAIRPAVAKTFALSEIAQAQEMFQAKGFVGKLVLIPPD